MGAGSPRSSPPNRTDTCGALAASEPGEHAQVGSAREVAVLHLPGMVKHVVGAAPDQELDRPAARRFSTGVVFADRLGKRLAVGVQVSLALASVQRNLDAHLWGELIDLCAVGVADDLLAVAPATSGTRTQRRRNPVGDVVEVCPARAEQG